MRRWTVDATGGGFSGCFLYIGGYPSGGGFTGKFLHFGYSGGEGHYHYIAQAVPIRMGQQAVGDEHLFRDAVADNQFGLHAATTQVGYATC